MEIKKTDEKLIVCISTRGTYRIETKNNVIAVIPIIALEIWSLKLFMDLKSSLKKKIKMNKGNNAKKFLKKTTWNNGILSAVALIQTLISTKKRTDKDL